MDGNAIQHKLVDFHGLLAKSAREVCYYPQMKGGSEQRKLKYPEGSWKVFVRRMLSCHSLQSLAVISSASLGPLESHAILVDFTDSHCAGARRWDPAPRFGGSVCRRWATFEETATPGYPKGPHALLVRPSSPCLGIDVHL